MAGNLEADWVREQDERVDRLVETLASGSANAIVSGAGGVGKTVTCCKVAVRMVTSARNGVGRGSLLLDDKSPKEDTSKQVTKVESKVVDAAARFIAKALEQVQQDDVQVNNCRVEWEKVKKAWLTLYPSGGTVPYSGASIYAYALGTTLMHAALTRELLASRLHSKLERVSNVVVLCGGSGAEVIGLRLALGNLNKQHSVRVDLVDVNAEWRHTSEKYMHFEDSKARLGQVKGAFHVIDLLTVGDQGTSCGDNGEVLKGLIQRADLVLLIYGLTELHDINRDGCERCLGMIAANMQASAEFLIVDPLKTQHGKLEWSRALLAKHGPLQSWREKVTIQECDVRDSAVGPMITGAHMRLNEDVKLSVHVWCLAFSPKSNQAAVDHLGPLETSLSPLPRVAVLVVPRVDHLIPHEAVLRRVCPGLRLFSLGTLSQAQTETHVQSALWHLYCQLTNLPNRQASGIVLLTMIQLAMVPRSKHLLPVFRSATLAVIDHSDLFLDISKRQRVVDSANTIHHAFGESPSRLVVCSGLGTTIDRPVVDLCLSKHHSPPTLHEAVVGSPKTPLQSPDFIPAFIEALETKRCGCIKVCWNCTGFPAGCLLDASTALLVTMERALPKEFKLDKGQSHANIRSLRELAGPLPTAVQDVVFYSHDPRKVPQRRLNELVRLGISRLVSLSRNSCTNKQVCVHVHRSISAITVGSLSGKRVSSKRRKRSVSSQDVS